MDEPDPIAFLLDEDKEWLADQMRLAEVPATGRAVVSRLSTCCRACVVNDDPAKLPIHVDCSCTQVLGSE